MDNILLLEDLVFTITLIEKKPTTTYITDALYYYRINRKNQLTSVNGIELFNFFTTYEYLQQKYKDSNSSLRNLILQSQLSNYFLSFIKIKWNLKKKFLLTAAHSIFNNYSKFYTYKAMLFSNYQKKRNHLLAPSFVALLHIIFIAQKVTNKIKNIW